MARRPELLTAEEAAQRSGRPPFPRTHTGQDSVASPPRQPATDAERVTQLETALRKFAAHPNLPGEVYLEIDALLSPAPHNKPRSSLVEQTWGDMGTADMVDEIIRLNTENAALRAWVLARCWHHHDWGAWPEDGLTFKVCVECQGWDAKDYDRLAAKGRVPQGNAGEYYGLDRRGHQANCLVGLLLQEESAR